MDFEARARQITGGPAVRRHRRGFPPKKGDRLLAPTGGLGTPGRALTLRIRRIELLRVADPAQREAADRSEATAVLSGGCG